MHFHSVLTKTPLISIEKLEKRDRKGGKKEGREGRRKIRRSKNPSLLFDNPATFLCLDVLCFTRIHSQGHANLGRGTEALRTRIQIQGSRNVLRIHMVLRMQPKGVAGMAWGGVASQEKDARLGTNRIFLISYTSLIYTRTWGLVALTVFCISRMQTSLRVQWCL